MFAQKGTHEIPADYIFYGSPTGVPRGGLWL